MDPKTVNEIFQRLRAHNPKPTTELKYKTPFELMIAVILSAQSTDVGVNKATRPLFAKIDVNGPQRHPLYAVLAGKNSPFPGNVKWNFEKFLIGRDGRVLQRFAADAEPDSAEVVSAVEAALAVRAKS